MRNRPSRADEIRKKRVHQIVSQEKSHVGRYFQETVESMMHAHEKLSRLELAYQEKQEAFEEIMEDIGIEKALDQTHGKDHESDQRMAELIIDRDMARQERNQLAGKISDQKMALMEISSAYKESVQVCKGHLSSEALKEIVDQSLPVRLKEDSSFVTSFYREIDHVYGTDYAVNADEYQRPAPLTLPLSIDSSPAISPRSDAESLMSESDQSNMSSIPGTPSRKRASSAPSPIAKPVVSLKASNDSLFPKLSSGLFKQKNKQPTVVDSLRAIRRNKWF